MYRLLARVLPIKVCLFQQVSDFFTRQSYSLQGDSPSHKLGKAIFFIVLISCAFNTNANTDKNTAYYFDIPQQPLIKSLHRLSNDAQALILFPYHLVETQTGNAIKGRYTVRQALDKVLQRTGLYSATSSKGVLTIVQVESAKNNDTGKKTMNVKKNVLTTVIGVFAATGMGTSSAEEQIAEASQQSRIDEIIVTAQKREQRLIDVPISIEALGEEKIKDFGITGLDDLARVVPNLSIKSVSDSNQTIVIRGVSNNTGLSALVGIYMDEIPLSFNPQIQANLQPIDIQRLEVLRGPQGTLYGQGSTGGTVRFITNNPNFDGFEGEIGASASSITDGDTSSEVKAVLNIPVIDDRLAFRLATSYKDRGGWIDQPDIGKEDANDNQASYVRLKALWQASDDLSVNAMVLRSRSDSGSSNIANIRGADGDTYYRTVVANGLPLANTDQTDENDIYNVTVNYDLGFATLTSSSSHLDIKNYQSSTSILVGQDPLVNSGVISLGITNESKGFAQEVRLASADSGNALNWLVGAFYSDTDFSNPSDDFGFFFNGFGGSLGGSKVFVTSKSTAIFADVGYDLSEQLTLTVGARYFEDDRTVGQNPVSDSASFDQLSPKVSLSYALSDDASIYASIAEGFRSGGFNDFGPGSYDAETVRSYEVGAKASLLNNRLSVAGAIFHSQYLDYQGNDIISVALNQTATINPGEVKMQGFEFSTQFSVSEQFSIGLSGHYLDTEFVKIADSVASPFNLGDPVNYTPKYSYAFNARYDFEWSFGAEGFALLDYNRQDGSVFTSRTRFPAPFTSDPTSLMNAQLGAQWQSFSVRLFGKNITNERDITMPAPGNIFTQNAPRSWGVDVAYKF